MCGYNTAYNPSSDRCAVCNYCSHARLDTLRYTSSNHQHWRYPHILKCLERIRIDRPLLRSAYLQRDIEERVDVARHTLCECGPKPADLSADCLFSRRVNRSEALFCAISLGHTACFHELAPAVSDASFPTLNGFDALCIAAATNQPAMLALLLREGALDVNTLCSDYDVHSGKLRRTVSPLMMACQLDAAQAVAFLVRQSDVAINAAAVFSNCRRDGSTALSLAALYGRTACVRALLRHPRVLVDALRTDGRSPLFFAAQRGSLDIASMLLRHARDRGATIAVDRAEQGGHTALFMAAKNGHAALVRLLLDADADALRRCGCDYWPLWIAAKCGHAQVVSALLESGRRCGADGECEDGTPLYAACEHGQAQVVRVLLEARQAATTQVAIEAEVDAVAIYQSAVYGNDQLMRRQSSQSRHKARAKKVNVNWVAKNGMTALLVATMKGHVECVRWLLRYAAEEIYVDEERQVELDAGSLVRVTATALAKKHGHDEIVEMLRRR